MGDREHQPVAEGIDQAPGGRGPGDAGRQHLLVGHAEPAQVLDQAGPAVRGVAGEHGRVVGEVDVEPVDEVVLRPAVRECAGEEGLGQLVDLDHPFAGDRAVAPGVGPVEHSTHLVVAELERSEAVADHPGDVELCLDTAPTLTPVAASKARSDLLAVRCDAGGDLVPQLGGRDVRRRGGAGWVWCPPVVEVLGCGVLKRCCLGVVRGFGGGADHADQGEAGVHRRVLGGRGDQLVERPAAVEGVTDPLDEQRPVWAVAEFAGPCLANQRLQPGYPPLVVDVRVGRCGAGRRTAGAGRR